MTKKEIKVAKAIIEHIENNTNIYVVVRIDSHGNVSAYSLQHSMRVYVGNIANKYFQLYWGL